MDYRIIGSSSKGNCIIIEDVLMIDAGLPFKYIKPYIDKVRLIFISHIHSDHLYKTTVRRIAKDYPDIVFIVGDHLVSPLRSLGVEKLLVIDPAVLYDLGIAKLFAFELYHDVPNYGLGFMINGFKGFFATDTYTLEGIEAKGMDYYFIEHHHQKEQYNQRIDEKISNGQFSHEIGAINSHLSFEDAESWLKDNVVERAEVIRLHMSSDEYYNDIPLRYVFIEGIGVVELDDFI